MTVEAVKALHEELGFARWESELRAITGVWASIQTLQKRASKDAASLKKYRQYLERCIGNLQTHDSVLADDELEARCAELRAFYQQRLQQLESKQTARIPHGVEDWCERWLSRAYQDHRLAMEAWLEKPTKRAFDRLMATAKAMYDEYENA